MPGPVPEASVVIVRDGLEQVAEPATTSTRLGGDRGTAMSRLYGDSEYRDAMHRDASSQPAERQVARSMTSWEKTLRIMTYRRLMRELHGTHTKPHPWRVALWILGFVMLEVGFASVSITEGIQVNIDTNMLVLSNLFGLLFWLRCCFLDALHAA